ncbi:MAG: anthranilate synthase component I [Proteobacteria bacterium]|nr:anthranilate synthase component I [Pseudomonadota bacterium]MBU1639350.1 anthranilate synthase component I [Pseudomonadota bacterium]
MYKPGLEDFKQLASGAGLIPVCREIVADLDTPLTVFAKLAGDESHAFLLESLEGGETWGRYSFVGYDPLMTFESQGKNIKIRQGDDVSAVSGDPIEELKKLLASFKACTDTDFLPRFFGGAVGYLGYDMVRFMERLPEKNPPLTGQPESSFMVPRFILIFDNLKQTLSVVHCVRVAGGDDLDLVYTQALRDIDTVIGRLKRCPLPYDVVEGDGNFATHAFTANMEPDVFREMVTKAKEYIMAGDIIQVVLSQRFHTKTDIPPFLLYRALRHVNPSPYLFYVRLGDVIQIGSSPEILVRLEDNKVEVRPIAGTRPRGKNREEDLALEKELLADPKECAEHLMLVDLGRNDLGRVAKYGTIETYDLMVVERYSHVMHIVSGVRGELAAGCDQFDVVRACFPAGTVSGAPKVRAMEIIEELEPQRRGPYAGAVGYFGFSGNMDFSITIRTFIMQGKDLWIQAGAGIVADSDPEMEYQETLNKSRGLRRAVELAEQGI